VKTGSNIAELSKQSYASKSVVLPMTMMMMMMTRRRVNIIVTKETTEQVKTFPKTRLSNL
jgi:hypothetical protein